MCVKLATKTKTKQKNKFRRIFRRIQQQKKTNSAGFFIRRIQQDTFRRIFDNGGIPAGSATKTNQKQVPPDIPADPATKKPKKNKFRRIFYPADPARQVLPDFLLRWNSGGFSNKNKTKTSSAGYSGGIPADPATKTKQKQVPPDIPADPATKTKQKQVLPDIPAKFRRIQQRKQNKKTSSAGHSGGSSNKKTKTSSAEFFIRRIQQDKFLRIFDYGGIPADSATKTKQKQVLPEYPAEFRWIQRQKQNKNKFCRIFRRNSGGSSNKNKTKTSSAGYSGAIPADPATKKTKTSSAG
jgi:hypothetical protein